MLPVGAADVRHGVADHRRRRVGDGELRECRGQLVPLHDGHGFFQLHRLSAFGAPHADRRHHHRGEGRRSALGIVRDSERERRAAQPLRALRARQAVALTHGFDIQAGRVPPTFGAFARRHYPYDNLLIGYPLAYQYLTSLRPDALPANADELLRMRGRGWLSNFSVGNPEQDNGMPLVHAFRWDTGVQVHAANQRAEATVALTTGTLANPLVGDDNSRPAGCRTSGASADRRLAGRRLVCARPVRDDRRAAHGRRRTPIPSEFTQTAWGGDAEYSRGYYLVRFEAIVSDWRLPLVRTPAIDLPLRAVSTSIEGRYKIQPGTLRRRALRSPHVQQGVRGRAARRPMGCARHPSRGRRRLLAAAERHR